MLLLLCCYAYPHTPDNIFCHALCFYCYSFRRRRLCCSFCSCARSLCNRHRQTPDTAAALLTLTLTHSQDSRDTTHTHTHIHNLTTSQPHNLKKLTTQSSTHSPQSQSQPQSLNSSCLVPGYAYFVCMQYNAQCNRHALTRPPGPAAP